MCAPANWVLETEKMHAFLFVRTHSTYAPPTLPPTENNTMTPQRETFFRIARFVVRTPLCMYQWSGLEKRESREIENQRGSERTREPAELHFFRANHHDPKKTRKNILSASFRLIVKRMLCWKSCLLLFCFSKFTCPLGLGHYRSRAGHNLLPPASLSISSLTPQATRSHVHPPTHTHSTGTSRRRSL